jgi:hypothetical protein
VTNMEKALDQKGCSNSSVSGVKSGLCRVRAIFCAKSQVLSDF